MVMIVRPSNAIFAFILASIAQLTVQHFCKMQVIGLSPIRSSLYLIWSMYQSSILTQEALKREVTLLIIYVCRRLRESHKKSSIDGTERLCSAEIL